MGRQRKPISYLILNAEPLFCVSLDRVYDPESDLEESFFDKVKCPVADDVIIAMRKAFSLTFPRNPFIDGIQAALGEIRRITVEAMKVLPEVLADLQLSPIPLVMDDQSLNKTSVFAYVFARTDDVDVTVSFEGKKRRFLDLVGNQSASTLLTTLRAVITDTFDEAHDEDQHMAILLRIRQRIWDVLPAFNAVLESIEIEPIAERVSDVAGKPV